MKNGILIKRNNEYMIKYSEGYSESYGYHYNEIVINKNDLLKVNDSLIDSCVLFNEKSLGYGSDMLPIFEANNLEFTKINIEFLNRNISNFKNFQKYVFNNSKNIFRIVVSPTMFIYLKHFNFIEKIDDNMLKYYEIPIIIEPYAQTDAIYFILKENKILFDLPCVCGIYEDEKHQ